MAANPWSKFFWHDWDSDPCVRACTLAAQALWMRMLCIAAKANPTGYVVINGQAVDLPTLARLCGCSADEAASLMDELDRNGVFSRDRKGRIYNRRMVRDAQRAAISRENGKQGGSPILSEYKRKKEWDNPPDKPPLKTQEPSIQKPEKESVFKSEGDLKTSPHPEEKRKRRKYPADFDVFWSGYPTDRNMSKLEAGQAWQRLDDEERKMAIESLPAFRSYCVSNKDYRPIHANRYLLKRRFEGHADAGRQISERANIRPGSEEWQAWRAYKIRVGEPITYMDSQEKAGSEYAVPSRWPPTAEAA